MAALISAVDPFLNATQGVGNDCVLLGLPGACLVRCVHRGTPHVKEEGRDPGVAKLGGPEERRPPEPGPSLRVGARFQQQAHRGHTTPSGGVRERCHSVLRAGGWVWAQGRQQGTVGQLSLCLLSHGVPTPPPPSPPSPTHDVRHLDRGIVAEQQANARRRARAGSVHQRRHQAAVLSQANGRGGGWAGGGGVGGVRGVEPVACRGR